MSVLTYDYQGKPGDMGDFVPESHLHTLQKATTVEMRFNEVLNTYFTSNM